MINCKIFLKEGSSSIQELRETVGHNLVCLTLKDLAEEITVCIDKKEEGWYDTFKILYNDNFSKHKHCISVKLKSELLFKYKINMIDISRVIESQYDDIFCVFSDLDNNQLDIFIDTTDIKFSEDKLLFVTEENANEIYLEECVQPILEKLIIFGVSGIKNIYYTNENGEWYVETDGSNFQELLGHPIVKMEKLHSNNVWDIFENLGIEAAREFLIQEFLSIMEGINICHVKLLVEKMTYSGTISSISRYTLRKDESGPFARSSFEESQENFLKSALSGDIEKIKGVSASIICGKRPLCGTGFMDLKIDIKQLKNAIPVFKDKINDGVVKEQKAVTKIKPYPVRL
jgi:DNA-directed RNA polymerase beta' subunit